MKTATTVVLMLIRLTGLILIILGALFWTGHATNLILDHMRVGTVFVLSLWTLSFLAIRRGASKGAAISLAIWGLVVLILGMTQTRILTGDAHWVIQVLHLLIGVAALAHAEKLGASTKRASAT